MAFDWAEYLDLAAELAERSEEAALRSAISRAYYASLGRARELLESEGEVFPLDGSVHNLVWQVFADSSDDRRFYIAVDGRWLRLNRNSADYDSELTDAGVRARQAVRKARTVLAALERVRS
jgi:hypothetical protein